MMTTFPKLNSPKRNLSVLSEFIGLDLRLGAEEGGFYSLKNMSTSALPRLSTRSGRKMLVSMPEDEKILAAYFVDRAYLITSKNGLTQLYFGDDFSSLNLVFTANEGESETSLLCRFDSYISLFNLNDYNNGTSLLAATPGTMNIPMRVEAPNFTDITIYEGRVFGCYRKQIRASAYNDLFDWEYDAEREDTTINAYLKNFPLNTEFTACTTYKNRAIFFTEDEMYELYGKNPLNFELVKIADVGCVNRQSVCIEGGKLYFVSREGIMCYSGAYPQNISHCICDVPEKINDAFVSAIGGAAGLISVCFEGKSGQKLYVYDTDKERWACEDSINAVSIVGKFGKRYIVTDSAVFEADREYFIDEADNDNADFQWEAVTAPIYAYTAARKRAAELIVFIEQARPANVEIFASFDGGDFELLKSEMLQGAGELVISLADRHYQKMQVKIKGKGEAQIHYIGQTFSEGGNVNG